MSIPAASPQPNANGKAAADALPGEIPTLKSQPTPTVAFLGGSPGGLYNLEKWLLWRGLADAARDFGVNLLYVAGEQFERDPQAVLYDLIDARAVDGVILSNAFIAPVTPLPDVQQFAQRFAPLPVVALDLPLPGCASVLTDDAHGIRALLEHLVEGHAYQKIAFVRATPGYTALERQTAFEDTLRGYGCFDPLLVGSLEELSARGIQMGQDARAVVAETDEMAIQVIYWLGKAGLRVPEDVVVTGFNDGREARGALPPLTTVRIPYRNLGQRAMEILMRLLRGDGTPDEVLRLNPYIILRRSCGCLEPLAEQAAAGKLPAYDDEDLASALARGRDTLPARMLWTMGTSVEALAQQWSGTLFEIFAQELMRRSVTASQPATARRTPSRAFLRKLSDLMRAAVGDGANVTRWHEALTTLRAYLLPHLSAGDASYAEDLFQQARVLVGQVAVRAEVHRSWRSARRADILRQMEAQLLIAADMDELLTIFTAGAAQLGVMDVIVALYESDSQADRAGERKARVILHLQGGERLTLLPDRAQIAARELLPPPALGGAQPLNRLVEALHLSHEQIGLVIFPTAPPADASSCDIYQGLKVALSAAIKGVLLRRTLQDALQAAEEANRLKSSFLSMVSHELRTPLNLIVGLSEMALRRQKADEEAGEPPNSELSEKYLEQIYVSGQHLDRLIRDVLDLAGSQVGQMKLTRQPLDLRDVLDDVAAMGEHMAAQKTLLFRMEVPPALPLIDGDRTRLRQVLLNLISNAVKFTAHGEVTIHVTVEDEDLLLTVRDSGLGIPKEDQGKIFDEFRQSDRSSARGYGGIGLGLAITRRLVELHGGRIWVESAGGEGSGSTFFFTLPILKAADSSPAVPAPAASRDGVVMIVTGADAAAAQPLADHLKRHGFRIETLSLQNTSDIPAAILADPPGAVVLDLAPASEQGWEIMQGIKDTPATQDIPVLFYSLLQDNTGGAVLHMDYLEKPVGADALVNALRRHGLTKSSSGKPRTVLVMDDEPAMLEMNTRILRAEMPGVQVLTAGNGREGLHMMRHATPDLVLLDLMMPELDGFGVLQAMQKEDALRNIPVIVLSGQSLNQSEMQRLNQGVAAVLGKGIFSTSEILSKIEDVLARNKRLGSEAQKLVQQAMTYIHEHYMDVLSRGEIADTLSVNEQYLSRCFTKEMGIGPMVYLSRYRIQRARRLLEEGNLSVTQVALEVGMSSQSYFSRVFQEETGVTPSAYQRGVRPPPK